MPEKHITAFSKFVNDHYGMKVTLEKSKTDGITFLSELKVCDGTQHDFKRALKKYSTSFNKYKGVLSLLYKDLGYYNPRVQIYKDKKFSQLPGFSVLGKFAYHTLSMYSKFRPGITLAEHINRAKSGSLKYEVYDTHGFISYLNQDTRINEFHEEVQNVYVESSSVVSSSLSELLDNYAAFKNKFLHILTKYYVNEIPVYPNNHGTLVVDGDVFDVTKFKLDINKAYEMVKCAIDLYNHGGSYRDESCTSLRLHAAFWNDVIKIVDGDLGAAAKEIQTIFQRYYKYAIKIKKQSKTTWSAQWLQQEWKKFQKIKK
jgi:hypothetical protein